MPADDHEPSNGSPPHELPDDLASLPTLTLDADELDDVELVLSGAFAPLTGFLNEAAAASIVAGGVLPGGEPWPADVSLLLTDTAPGSAHAPAAAAERLALLDPEGTPVALLSVAERAPVGAKSALRLSGALSPLRPQQHGTFRALRRIPADVRAELPSGAVLAVVLDRPLLQAEQQQLLARAEQAGAFLLVLVRGAATAPVPADLVIRYAQRLARRAAAGSVVVLGLHRRASTEVDQALAERVALTFGATEVVVAVKDPAWSEVLAAVQSGEVLAGEVDEQTATELVTWRPPRDRRGLVLFFTGFSGSGKSTIARGVVDALLEEGRRKVTLLDGDLVRLTLSSGLGFSRTDRDRNITRIGWVAAEIARHGGLSVCAPIAPYAQTRARVRAMAEDAGDFMLVHVSTPLEVCEARDRKGLYAKARAGIIPEFTGISDPYEVPTDADLVLDTSTMTIQAAVALVLERLVDGGYLD